MSLISQYGGPQSLWTRLPSAAKVMPEYRVLGSGPSENVWGCQPRNLSPVGHTLNLIRQWCWGVGYVGIRIPNIGGVAARTPRSITHRRLRSSIRAIKNVLSTVDRYRKVNGFLSKSISERSASLLGDGAGHWCQPCRDKRAFARCSAAAGGRQSDHAGAVRKDFRVNEAARGSGARDRTRQQRRFIQSVH